MRGSRDGDGVIVILDRDVTPHISNADPRGALEAMRSQLQKTAQQLFDDGQVTKVADDRGPQFWHWQLVITAADLGRPAANAN